MEYFITILLTSISIWYIIKIVSRSGWKNINYPVYSQSAIHNRIRFYMPKIIVEKEKIMSQSEKHISNNMIKIIVIDEKAYWIKDNTFYTAEMKNGVVLAETVQQIDTSKMSKDELDKMLAIVDNLNNGDS